LDLTGRVVTADALHTQRETARFLVEEKQAHYLLTVKKNQPTLYADLCALSEAHFPPLRRNPR
jgi:predicted transposase YbfD/YdcC